MQMLSLGHIKTPQDKICDHTQRYNVSDSSTFNSIYETVPNIQIRVKLKTSEVGQKVKFKYAKLKGPFLFIFLF
jgi:hypothetical protein